MAMRWARTLILAHMLIKAVRDNVAHEAATGLPGLQKENSMNDDAMVTPTSTAAAPTPSAPVADAPPQQVPDGDINTILTNAANLAQALGDNPGVLTFMNALMAAAKAKAVG